MEKNQYIQVYGKKRQEAVKGRAGCGPIIPLGSADSVLNTFPGLIEKEFV
jgi:hypothetical protein